MLTLVEFIRGLNYSERATVLQSWALPEAGRAAELSTEDIVTLLGQYWTVSTLVEQLSDAERALIWLMIAQPRATISLDVLLRSIAAPPDSSLLVLRRLTALGVVQAGPAASEFITGPAEWSPGRSARGRMLSVPPELLPVLLRVHQVIHAVGPAEQVIEATVDSSSLAEIQAIARRWGIDRPHEFFRRDLVTSIVERLQDAAVVDTVLSTLTPGTRAVFDWLTAQGKRAFIADACLQFDQITVRTAWQQLRPLLLVRDGWQDGKRFLMIPPEVARRDAPKTTAGAISPVQAPARYDDHGYWFARDLISMVDFVAREPVKLTVGGQRLPKRTVAQIMGLLGRPEPDDRSHDRFDFLLHTALRLGLIETDDGTYRATSKIDELVAMGLPALTRLLFTGWQDDAGWYEAAGYEGMYWSSSRPTARKRLLRHLAELPPGQWFRTTDLAAHIKQADPHFMRSRHDILRFRGSRALTEAMEQWDQVEGRLIRVLIEAPLHWLGVVALAQSREPDASTWCLTALGAWLTGKGPAPADRRSGAEIVVQPTFEVVVIRPESVILHQLNQFADVLQTDIAARYSLTRESVLRGVAHGWSVGSMVELLVSASGHPIPQNVDYSLHEWGARFRPATIRTAMLVEFDQAEDLDAWLATEDGERFAVHRVGPAALALPTTTSTAELEQNLRARGYHPRLEIPATQRAR